MNAVGIDVSKGKSMVAILRPMGEVVRKPFEVSHDYGALETLAYDLKGMEGETRVVMEYTGRYGVGKATGPQLMAEIGDVRRFSHRGALIAYAGVDPQTSQSGKYKRKSDPISRKDSGLIRKTLFQVMETHLRKSPDDESVYQFLDKKRREGKPYYVYMTAAANKFLRIYYARVKEHLNALGLDVSEQA